MTFHEYANIFPMLSGEALNGLRADIAEHGVREPVVFLDGKILDGRNRHACATELGVDFPTVEYNGSDPLAYVISQNLHRRHLSESQRAMVASNLAKLEPGQKANAQICAPSQSDAADMLNVSRRAVQSARKVQAEGSPELIRAVENGVASVSAASDVATLPAKEQVEIVARGDREILAAAKSIRAKTREAKRAEALASIKEEWELRVTETMTTAADRLIGEMEQ